MLSNWNLINLKVSLQAFSQINHDGVLDRIKKVSDRSEATRQSRAACYIALTRFLSRRIEGIIKRAVTCREGSLSTTKTFGATRSVVKSEALTPVEWMRLIDALTNKRDALIVKMLLQGAKRVNEVLSLTVDKVDFDKRQAFFKQSKTRGEEKEIPVTSPESLNEKT